MKLNGETGGVSVTRDGRVQTVMRRDGRELTIRDGRDGRSEVSVRIFARCREFAVKAYEFADENPPVGWKLVYVKIAKRPKGGRARFLRLHYRQQDGPQEIWYEPSAWLDMTLPELALCQTGIIGEQS